MKTDLAEDVKVPGEDMKTPIHNDSEIKREAKEEQKPLRIKTELMDPNLSPPSLSMFDDRENSTLPMKTTAVPPSEVSRSVTLPRLSSTRDPTPSRISVTSPRATAMPTTQIIIKAEPTDTAIDISVDLCALEQARQAKRRRVFMDAVVVPSVSSIGIHRANAASDHEEIYRKIELFRNPAVKKPKDMTLAPDTVRLRLQKIGYDLYPIDLEKHIRDVTVRRDFMSENYGGNTQATFPIISQEFIDKTGISSFMYPNLSFNPHCPEVPGAPGMFFGTRLTGESAGEWTGQERVISRLDQGVWLYVGQYELEPAPSLTIQEWKQQSAKVRNTWANEIKKKDWGRTIRAVVATRNGLGRTPTKAEEQAALESPSKFSEVTVKDIIRAFDRGQAVIAVWTMKCVGYDVDFQRNLAAKMPFYVPRKDREGADAPAKKVKAPKTTKALTKAKQGAGSTGQKKRKLEDMEDSAAYRHRGTRSRPTDMD
ncbi:hypothetical protein B0H10DRAFT_536072 [Mycena sp. CBHHK59/15]|nr:hypothetical protein B0H10DRAFT_536072 [Mycena sp. CBHHK59/15]